MKNIILRIGCIGLLICCSSCTNYLDIVPDNVATIEYAFRNKTEANKFLTTCYSYLPMTGSLKNVPEMSAGDELWTYPSHGEGYKGYQIARGNQNATLPLLNLWDGGAGGDTNAKSLWQGIRNCNILIENIDTVLDLPPHERSRWKAEAKFLKAYYHFYLFRAYGPIPIMDVNLPITTPTEEMKVYRNTVDECVAYIAGLFEEAAADLPLRITAQASEMGRVTSAAAMSLRAKVLVTAASPLFNGDPDFMELQDNRGVRLFPQEKDPAKWNIAAEACLKAIELCHEAGITLYKFSGPDANNMSDELRLTMDIRESVCERWNSETIWGITNWEPHIQQSQFQPRLSADYRLLTDCQHWGATMAVAEMFYTKNGVPMEEDNTDNYIAKKLELRTATADEKSFIEPARTTVQMHFDREPRFYASLGFDGSAWLGDTRLSDDNLWYLRGKKGEYSGLLSQTAYSQTGYYVKKLVSYTNTFAASAVYYTAYWFPMPMMRLADLYLLYAEALNESLPAPNADVWFYVNEVRSRAGIESVEDSWTKYSTESSKYTYTDGMRDIIQRERMIELVFEGHRFWDIRRWKRLEEFMNEPVMGWNIEGEDNQSYYVPLTYYKRKYSRRDYFWPLKDETVRRNTNLVQNVGW